jgi:hypothetical protein
MERRGLFATIGGALIAGAAVVVALLSLLGLPKGVVIGVAGLFLVLGLLLVLTAVGGLRRAAIPIEPNHQAQLRTIAERAQTDDPYRTAQERQMFNAHFPDIAATRDALTAATENEAASWESLRSYVLETLLERFPDGEFWNKSGLRAVAEHKLKLKAERPELDPMEIQTRRIRTGGALDPPRLAWRDYVVWERDADMATDAELAAKQDTIRGWFEDLVDSDPAQEYRRALKERRRLHDRLAADLEPVLHLAPIQTSRDCTICRPR